MQDPCILQRQANDYDRALRIQQHQTWRGLARFSIDSLTYDKLNVPERKVRALLTNFRKGGGCHPLQRDNYIKVVLTQERFKQALVASQAEADQLLHPGDGDPPELIFPSAQPVLVVEGQSRIEAAKQFLTGADRWWIAEVYIDEGNYEFLLARREHYPNAAPFSDGEIYRKIQEYRGKPGHYQEEERWWRTSECKIKNLKLLLKEAGTGSQLSDDGAPQNLAQMFNKLVPFPGLWPDRWIGVVHKLLALRCVPEDLNYGSAILQFWEPVAGKYPEIVDARSVDILECRCPKYSASDRSFVQLKMESRELFPAVHDESERKRILVFILEFPELILTMRTYFAVLPSRIQLRNIIKHIVSPHVQTKRVSLRDQCRAIWQPQSRDLLECRAFEFCPPPSSVSDDDLFEFVYRELILAVARLGPDCCFGLLRKDRKRKTIEPEADSRLPHSEQSWTLLRATFKKLGFDISGNTDIDSTPTRHEFPSLMTTEDDAIVPMQVRRGNPFEAFREFDRRGLFLPRIYDEMEPGQEFTVLFVRRAFFRAIFGTSYLKTTIWRRKRKLSMSARNSNYSSSVNRQKHAGPATTSTEVPMPPSETSTLSQRGFYNQAEDGNLTRSRRTENSAQSWRLCIILHDGQCQTREVSNWEEFIGLARPTEPDVRVMTGDKTAPTLNKDFPQNRDLELVQYDSKIHTQDEAYMIYSMHRNEKPSYPKLYGTPTVDETMFDEDDGIL